MHLNSNLNPKPNPNPDPSLVSLALERGVGDAAATCAVFAICLKVDILPGVLTSIVLRTLYLLYCWAFRRG